MQKWLDGDKSGVGRLGGEVKDLSEVVGHVWTPWGTDIMMH